MEVVMSSASRSRLPIASPALFLGGLLWIISFVLPVFYTEQGSIAGYWVFATGWMGFTIFQFAWYANLLIIMAVLLMYTAPLRATLIAGLAVLVATQAFWFDAVPDSAVSTAIKGHGSGFWFWYASILLMGIGVVFGSDNMEPDERAQRDQLKQQSHGKETNIVEPEIMQLAAAPIALTHHIVQPEPDDILSEDPWPEAATAANLPVAPEITDIKAVDDLQEKKDNKEEHVASGQLHEGWQFFTGRKEAETRPASSD